MINHKINITADHKTLWTINKFTQKYSNNGSRCPFGNDYFILSVSNSKLRVQSVLISSASPHDHLCTFQMFQVWECTIESISHRYSRSNYHQHRQRKWSKHSSAHARKNHTDTHIHSHTLEEELGETHTSFHNQTHDLRSTLTNTGTSTHSSNSTQTNTHSSICIPNSTLFDTDMDTGSGTDWDWDGDTQSHSGSHLESQLHSKSCLCSNPDQLSQSHSLIL